jgi:RimJ/RimL family protein N-acetyltransferase
LLVFLSNPDALVQTEGSDGEIGKYDLERWQRDWYIAQMMPGRHMLGCYLKPNDDAIGFAEYVEEHDRLGQPWFGAIVIRKDVQRQGLASEIMNEVIEHIAKETDALLLYSGVLEQNVVGQALAQRVGFTRSTRQASHQFPMGRQEIIVLERPLITTS